MGCGPTRIGSNPYSLTNIYGRLDQRLDRFVDIEEASGSIPLVPTIYTLERCVGMGYFPLEDEVVRFES